MFDKIDKDFILSHRKLLLKLGVALIIIIAALFSLLKGSGSEDEFVLKLRGEDGTEQTMSEAELTSREAEKDEPADEEKKSIFVDVDGAVASPGLYELDAESRVNDAIEKAGGTTEGAELRFINRAELLNDGDKLYIPFEGESESLLGAKSGSSSVLNETESQGLININTASSAELQRLNGVGPATAEKIIAYRNQNGAFSKPEDIKRVSGIGEKTYEKLKDKIRV